MSKNEHQPEEVHSPDVHFDPVVQLAAVEVVTMEEEEEELIQLRAKLFRFDNTESPPQWKERGTGTVKLLRHKNSDLVRVLMRRDKTLKLCANHYVQPQMELKPNCGSDKSWVWTTQADFSDGEARPELLAMRFANAENAQKWKAKFTEAQLIMQKSIPEHNEQISAGKLKGDSSSGEVKDNSADEEKDNSGVEGKESSAGEQKESSAGEQKESSASSTETAPDSGESNKEDATPSGDTDTSEADSVADKLVNLTVKENSKLSTEDTSQDKSNEATSQEKSSEKDTEIQTSS